MEFFTIPSIITLTEVYYIKKINLVFKIIIFLQMGARDNLQLAEMEKKQEKTGFALL